MSRKIFLPRPEVEKLSLTSSPCPLCEALGSASFSEGGDVTIEDSDSGGAIFAPNARIQLSRGVFIGNRAGKVGGAIAALEENDHKVVLANSLLVRNSAPKGSAFWGNRASFVNSTIADNSGTAIWPQDIPFGPTLAMTPFFNDTEVARPSFSVTPPRHLHDPKPEI